MITDWINLSRVSIQGAEHIYPKGVDWNITPGINAVIGGTGLGKTTLVYALQFAIFGKMVVDASERIEREFFKDRLTRRSGKKLKKNPPLACVEFTAGNAKFIVKRNLLTGALTEVGCNGSEVRAKDYEAILAEKVGVKDDFESLARLQGHLFFFGESRYLLAWENMLQHELINLMMADHATYLRLGELWEKVESADSAARNISAQAVRLEADLQNLSQSASKVAELQQRSDARQLSAARIEQERRVASIRKQLGEEERLEASQSEQIARTNAEFHHRLSELESARSSDLDDSLLAAALASPTIASVRHALEEFYRTPESRGCPCCGRTGIVAVVSPLAHKAVASAEEGNCIICSKPLPNVNGDETPVWSALTQETSDSAQSLQTLLFQREQTKSRIGELRADEARVLQALAETREAEMRHAQQSPDSAASIMRITIDQMREREAGAKKEREKHLAQLKRELSKTNAVFGKIQSSIAKAFKKYATLYLDEPCDVAFLKESELPGKRGPQIKAPHAAFFPVVSGQTRPSAQALSDAQRSFIDLAFRMAVIDVWHQLTKRTVTMIVETPEGAVDLAYMERVATMIRTFADQGHTLIITTNLNNEFFLPGIMARWPKAERAKHILNLLEQGNPRPVQIAHKGRFNAILAMVDSRQRAK